MIIIVITIIITVVVVSTTHHTLVRHGTKFAVFSLVTDISATVAPISVKLCKMIHMCLDRSSPLLEAVPFRGSPKSQMLGLNFGHLTANISKMVHDN